MNSNTISIILVTILIALGAYWFFFTGTGNEPPITAVGATGNTAQMKFQVPLSQLQSITFSTQIFQDPRFMALVDLTTPIEPESSGRIDPFAPVTAAVAANTPVTKKTGR